MLLFAWYVLLLHAYYAENVKKGLLVNSPLRTAIPREIFDYQQAMSALEGYSTPRGHMAALMRKKAVIRVKKGLYVFGAIWQKHPVATELLANLIYGPSYLSLEYALSYHGLILEQVTACTSVCIGRSRAFDTPLGRFSYRQIASRAYSIGFTRVELETGDAFLMALPEKALADKVAADRQGGLRSRRAMLAYLLENQRIEERSLHGLSIKLLHDIADRYGSRKVEILVKTVQYLRGS